MKIFRHAALALTAAFLSAAALADPPAQAPVLEGKCLSDLLLEKDIKPGQYKKPRDPRDCYNRNKEHATHLLLPGEKRLAQLS